MTVMREQLEQAWDEEVSGSKGRFSLVLSSLEGPVATRDADEPHYAASTIKLAALGALLHGLEVGEVREGSAVAVRDRFPSAVGGRFRLRQEDDQDDETWQYLGSLADLMWLADRMITVSGNLAAGLVMDEIGLPAVRGFLDRAGLGQSIDVNRMIGDHLAEAADVTNTVTAGGLAALMAGITDGSLLGADATGTALDLLSRQTHRPHDSCRAAGRHLECQQGWLGAGRRARCRAGASAGRAAVRARDLHDLWPAGRRGSRCTTERCHLGALDTMARIVEVATARMARPLHTPFVTALRRTEHVFSVVVRVTDADGREGFGEAPQIWRVTGESQASIEACVLGPLADLLLGSDPMLAPAADLHRDLASAVVANGGARAATEIAVQDLLARAAGVPLARFLGGRAGAVGTDVTIAAQGAAWDPAGPAASTFDQVKVKVGLDPSDVDRVIEIHRTATTPVRVDANQAWDLATATSAVEAWLAAGVQLDFLEQPLPAWDLAGHAELRQRVPVPIVLDESVFTIHDLQRAIDAGSGDIVNIKLAKCGGLHAGLELAGLASEAGLGPDGGFDDGVRARVVGRSRSRLSPRTRSGARSRRSLVVDRPRGRCRDALP